MKKILLSFLMLFAIGAMTVNGVETSEQVKLLQTLTAGL